jgi:hypothetical protein
MWSALNFIYNRICRVISQLTEYYLRFLLFLFRKAGPTHRDRASLIDFALSLVPPTLVGLYFTLFGLYNNFQVVSRIDLNKTLHNIDGLNLKSTFATGYLFVFILSLLATTTALLKSESFFKIQIAAVGLGFFMKALGFMTKHVDWTFHVPKTVWTFGFLVGLIYANKRYRVAYFPFRTSYRMRTRFFPPRSAGRHRILFIEPALKKDVQSPSSTRRRVYPMTTPYLAALLPSNWDPMIIDVLYDQIDYDIDTDVVAITAMAHNFEGVEIIANGFRAKGKTVIFGGADPSRQPEKYLEFADSVLVGAAEGFIESMLGDWENGKLQRKYVNLQIHDLKNMALPRYDLLPLRRYLNMHNILVSTSCPYHCSFCQYNRTREPRLRPVEDVVKAIQATPSKFFWFEAPELMAYKKYIRELEGALKGKNINWNTHATMKSCSDPETLRMAYSAGLRYILIGVESYNQETLKVFNKKMNIVADYPATFDLLNKAGISVSVHLIFGCYTDQVEDFQKALDGLIRGKVANVHVHLMAAFAGDEAFEQELIKNGAVEYSALKSVQTKKRHGITYYHSKNIDDQQMAFLITKFHEDFYSLLNIFRRLALRSWKNFPNFLQDIWQNIDSSVTRRSHGGYSLDFYQTISEYHNESKENVVGFFRKPEPKSKTG